MEGRSSPHDERLRPHERITDEFEYKQVIRKGRLLRSDGFKVYILKDKDLKRKAGFIAGRGVGRAWRRNRAKRLLKEAYRHLKSRLQPTGFQIVFVAGKGAAEGGITDIQSEMRRALEACGLLNGARQTRESGRTDGAR